MPKHPKSSQSAAQAKLREDKAWLKNAEKIRAKKTRERDKELVRVLKAADKYGISKSKSFELTPYRRKKANKIVKSVGEFFDPTKYIYTPVSKKEAKTVIQKTVNLLISVFDDKGVKKPVSKTGIFIPKEGHTRAKLTYNKKSDEYSIERSGKTKRGPTAGKIYKTITPLVGLDELDKERDRLINQANSFGQLKKGERISFHVHENGIEGYCVSVFSDIEALLNYLDNYKKKTPARVQFYRHIEIVKVESVQDWKKKHPSRSAGSRGRDEIRRRNKG